MNSLSAILLGEELGLNPIQIKRGIETFELTKKRMDVVDLKNGAKIINDAYNASFESMQASLRYLSRFIENRKIPVLYQKRTSLFSFGKSIVVRYVKIAPEISGIPLKYRFLPFWDTKARSF